MRLAQLQRGGSLQNLNTDPHSIPKSDSHEEPSRDSHSAQEKIVDTEDPDIQIIESSNSPNSIRLTRKRPLQTNGRVYKDHSKNVLFKVWGEFVEENDGFRQLSKNI